MHITNPIRAMFLGAAITGIAVASPVAAQDAGNFEVEGSVRVRYETFDGGFRPGGIESDDAVLFRTLLNARYNGDGFRLGATLQDSRAYANDARTPLGSSDINAVELIELFAEVDLGESARLTLGRQTMNLGSKRLVGNPNYRNAANGFTGARLDTELGGGSLTAFYVLPQQRLPSEKAEVLDNAVEWDRESDDLAFWGAFYRRPNVGPLAIEAYLYGLDEDDSVDRATRNRHLYTTGIRLVTAEEKGRPDAELEVMYQTGDIRASRAPDVAELDVSAISLHAEAGYTFDTAIEPRVAVFYDLATGDEGDAGEYSRFDPLFGPRYGDWGPSSLFGPLSRANISSFGAAASASFSSRVDAQVQLCRAWLESATDTFANTGVRDASGMAGRDAGWQVQGRLRWWIVPGVLRQELGGGWLAKGEFFDEAPNAPNHGDTHYGYAMVELSF
ncbi:alginate export family protein [Aurantiacibacter poecillastricola]|uniref:alginate export family protein n=1 Tax=Aurantiacibacter poecillastricola TaxID=3064385 RepID=UPI00273DE408|nr:alginate export family protein [Aurantiacibacter sp. 219JJ12-13]MDP5260872.1 alginate export family protein [Aurantiacibacter sp. 219JJ12-13]